MKKTFLPRPASSRKQRGVAIVFSLGILGLLAVLALGFASTAMLNNSVSQNVMNDAYARTLARNLALTQAIYLINDKAAAVGRGYVDYRQIYTYGTESSNEVKDFLWKLDCSFSGKSNTGVDQSVSIYTFDPSDTGIAANPANNVRWQYVKDSSQTKILGRYAYVVVPDKGGICPSINTGVAVPVAADFTPEVIKSLEKYISIGTTSKGNMANNASTRWMSYGELIAKCQWTSANSYNNMFKHYGLVPALSMKTPEAYLEDGKWYSRFNLNRTDWEDESMTPEKLCGVGVTLAEFPAEQKCIPWLKKMYDKGGETQEQALQIAANIIQYNCASTSDAVSDSDDWLTTAPNYIGIGRHPMLNELGFLVHVKPSVEATLIGEDVPNGKATYRYTPKYYVTLDTGAELLYQCGVGGTSSMKTSEVTFRGNITVRLSKFKTESELQNNVSGWLDDGALTESGLDTDNKATLTVPLDAASAPSKTAENDPVSVLTASGYGWTGFKLSFAKAAWNSEPAYTMSNLFWRRQQGTTKKTQCLVIELPSFQLETEIGLGSHGDISTPLAKGMRVETIEVAPTKILLKYDGKNRDFVQELDPYIMGTASDFKPASASAPAEEHAWFVAYEATDPLVNLKKADWTKRTPSPTPAAGELSVVTADPANYPGSIYDTAGSEKHLNRTLTEDLSEKCETLLKSYANITESLTEPEPAFDRARRLPTGIIRHGQMVSFWELGCVSRGKPFETLNLLKKSGTSPSPDFSYDRGDAALFDQLKLSDNIYTEGKFNLNMDRHKLLEQIFGYSTTLGFLMQSGTSSKVSALAYRKNVHVTAAGKTPGSHLFGVGTADRTFVKCSSQTTPSNATMYPSTVPDHGGVCLPCALRKATEHYCIQNRGDLLLDHADLPAEGGTIPAEDDWNDLQDLLQSGNTYLEKIQIAAKIMPVLRTDPADTIYVIVLAQSIKDIGGNVPMMRDWNGTGIETAVPSSNSSTSTQKRAMYMAGFRRSITVTKITGLTEPPVSGTDDGTPRLIKIYTKNEFGKYDLGSDKITGQARLIATLVRNPETGKWKLLRVQNVQ